jgi:hypothetical protein
MKFIKKLLCVGLLVSAGFSSLADTFFDNTSLYNGNAFVVNNGQPIGNEVTLGAGWSLTNFQFEYYSPSLTLNSSLGVDVRFYLNNGPLAGGYPTPGTLFYDSGWYYNTLGGIPGGANDLDYANSDLYSSSLPGAVNLPSGFLLPGDFTFVITFTNLGADTIELPLANNTAGTNYGTYWLEDNTGNWTLLTNAISGPANFVSEFAGTVPEPSPIALCAIGGALLFGVNKLRRKL